MLRASLVVSVALLCSIACEAERPSPSLTKPARAEPASSVTERAEAASEEAPAPSPAKPAAVGSEIFDHLLNPPGENGHARELVATPTGDLIAAGNSGEVLRLLTASTMGVVAWDRRYAKYGSHSVSAALLDDAGLVVASNEFRKRTPWLGRFDPATGDPVWMKAIRDRDCQVHGVARVGEELWAVGYCRSALDTASKAWLGRFASDGAKLATLAYERDDLEWIDIVVVGDDVVVVGNTRSKGSPLQGFVAWLDGEGAIERSRSFAGSGSHRFIRAVATPDGLVAGGSAGTVGEGAKHWPWAVGLTARGKSAWTFATKERSGEVAGIVAHPKGGTLLLGAASESTDGQAWMTRLDARGKPQWSHDYGKPIYGSLDDAAILGDGRIVAVGTQQIGNSAKSGFWLLGVDAQGEPAGPSSARNTPDR